MPEQDEHPFVDAQAMTDVDTSVYEAIATLEASGRPVAQDQIAAASHLDDESVAQSLAGLTERGVLIRSDRDGGAAFELARRDWSAEPGRPGRGSTLA
jgi:predicted transcriptional regulator